MTTAKEMRVVRLAVPAAELAAISRSALDRPLVHAAELVVGVPSDEAVVLGSTQRLSEVAVDVSMRIARRGSCGAEAAVGPGTVWLQLALANPGALVACEPGRLLNRYLRPLLRALTRVGARAHYFDRDWVSASHGSAKAPVALVAFAHDSTTGRALVEALVAVSTPFAVRARATFLGKAPLTLRALGVDPDVDAGRVAGAVIDAYASAYGNAGLPGDRAFGRILAPASELDDPRSEPPWAATREEAIGLVGAGRDRDGRVRIGGELMVSRDALARLEREVEAASSHGAIDAARLDRAVDALAAENVAILGVRSLRSLREVIDETLHRTGQK